MRRTVSENERGTEREIDREREREGQTERERQREKEGQREMDRERERWIERERETATHTARESERDATASVELNPQRTLVPLKHPLSIRDPKSDMYWPVPVRFKMRPGLAMLSRSCRFCLCRTRVTGP